MTMRGLETSRLILRRLNDGDLEALSALHAEPSFWWYPWERGQTREETCRFLERQVAAYEGDGIGLHAVIDKASGALAGWAGLSVPTFLPEVLPATEVGWRLGSAWRGMGFATEAGAAWVKWGFDHGGLAQILSIYEPENSASGRVMDKLGFRLERVTTHPRLGRELHVRALARERYLELCDAGNWPVEGGRAGAAPARTKMNQPGRCGVVL